MDHLSTFRLLTQQPHTYFMHIFMYICMCNLVVHMHACTHTETARQTDRDTCRHTYAYRRMRDSKSLCVHACMRTGLLPSVRISTDIRAPAYNVYKASTHAPASTNTYTCTRTQTLFCTPVVYSCGLMCLSARFLPGEPGACRLLAVLQAAGLQFRV